MRNLISVASSADDGQALVRVTQYSLTTSFRFIAAGMTELKTFNRCVVFAIHQSAMIAQTTRKRDEGKAFDMPTRILRDWTDSQRLENVSAEAERLFVRLIMKADDFGRYHADARLVTAGCLPLVRQLTADGVESWLDELKRADLISIYESGGRKYLEIKRFGQRTRAEKSRFPGNDGQVSVKCQSSDGQPRSYSETETKTETKAGADTITPPAPVKWEPLKDTHTELEALRFAQSSHKELARSSEPHLSVMIHKYAADPINRAKALNDFATHYSGEAAFPKGRTAVSVLESYLRREFENWDKPAASNNRKREAWQIEKDVEILRGEMTALQNRCRFDYDGKTKHPAEWKEHQTLRERIQALEKEAVQAAKASAP